MERGTRIAAVGGVLGPAAFVGAWAVLGATARGYEPIENPISRLAAVGAPTRPAMTIGFLAFAAGVGAYASAVRADFDGATAAATAGTAVATVGIATLPLGAPNGDGAHAVAAAAAYVTLAATPILGAVRYAKRRQLGMARLSRAVGILSGVALTASALAPSRHGFYQRVGLTVGHLWIAATAVGILRRPPHGRPMPA